MRPMYRSVIAALLFGLFPQTHNVPVDFLALEQLQVAPPSNAVSIPAEVSAAGIAVYDAESGQQIYGKEARVQRPMASLTKLMTALVIAENHDMDEVVKIPTAVADVTGNIAYLPAGKHFTVGGLLSALLITSANDAALTLAQFHSGSQEAFAAAMNERALQLGMTGTSFRNPAGLDHPAQWSTPQDIAMLTMFVWKNPEIANRISTAGARIVSVEGDTINLYHTHSLLHESGPVIAGKTGTTSDAGECLMSIVEKENRTYVVVLMYSKQRYQDMRAILTALEPQYTPVAARASVE